MIVKDILLHLFKILFLHYGVHTIVGQLKICVIYYLTFLMNEIFFKPSTAAIVHNGCHSKFRIIVETALLALNFRNEYNLHLSLCLSKIHEE